jgi:ribosome-dependent ATPase
MNEADRCDRISLMHAGKVLAVGTPQELVRKRGSPSLEDAFISYLAEAAGIKLGEKAPPPAQGAATPAAEPKPHGTRRFDLGRLWAYARRETMELLCDPIRLAFAAFGPLILMIAFGYGISLDVENLRFGAFDQDRTPESRTLIEAFSSVPRYFDERPPPIASSNDLDRRFRSGDLQVAVEIPPAYGRDLQNGRVPEVAVWVDGSMPFRGETTKGT